MTQDDFDKYNTKLFYGCDAIEIGKNVSISPFVVLYASGGKIVIGKETAIGPFTVIYGGKGVKIGENVAISTKVTITSGNHDYIGLSIPMGKSAFSQSVFKREIEDGFTVVIDDNVWVGANAVITDSVHIKTGAIVAAGAVVTKDVEEYDIVAGVPAVVIGNRKNNPIFGYNNADK